MCTGYDETRFFKHMTSTRRAVSDEDKWQDAIDTGSVSSYSIMMTGAASGQAAAETASVNVEDVFSYKVRYLFWTHKHIGQLVIGLDVGRRTLRRSLMRGGLLCRYGQLSTDNSLP